MNDRILELAKEASINCVVPTYAVFVEGASGVVVYGEISPVVVVALLPLVMS